MHRAAWIIRVARTPEGKWRALTPVWTKYAGKRLLTERALYKGIAIARPGWPLGNRVVHLAPPSPSSCEWIELIGEQ